ncbi:MAG: cell division protein ZapB [Desulfobacteraceae bacterium]|nr:cell division protein ZapB [Desulfobacteraceae bacterium]MCF8094027.1 cell division protein ZapB [Desulfobacteraceae bacterium]
MLQLDNLVEKVDGLIKRCQNLERENADLTDRVKQLESELEQKAETENQFSTQKAQIRSKIDNLIAKLDSITENGAAEE